MKFFRLFSCLHAFCMLLFVEGALKIVKPTDDDVLKDGETFNFLCKDDFSYMKLDIWFELASKKINSKSTSEKIGGVFRCIGTFSMKITRLNDEQILMCLGKGERGPIIRDSVALKVEFAPVATVESAVVKGYLGENVVIQCNYESRPKTGHVFFFKRDDPPMDVGSGRFLQGWIHVRTEHDNRNTLTIYRVERRDAGTYYCVAENKFASVESPNIRLDVEIRPILKSTPDVKLLKRKGSITFTCSFTLDPPATEIRWVKIAKDKHEVIEMNERFSYDGSLKSPVQMTVRNLDYNDTDNYTCEIVNDRGAIQTKYLRVCIGYSPLLNITPATVVVREKSQFSLQCNWDAQPAIWKIKWFHQTDNGSVEIRSLHAKYDFKGRNRKNPSPLYVSRVKMNDSGIYTCYGINEKGTAYSKNKAEVTVQFYPRPIRKYTKIIVHGGKKVKLKCPVFAVPPDMNYTWKYKLYFMKEQTETIQVETGPLGKGFGLYTCVAMNMIGKSENVYLHIIEKESDVNKSTSYSDLHRNKTDEYEYGFLDSFRGRIWNKYKKGDNKTNEIIYEDPLDRDAQLKSLASKLSQSLSGVKWWVIAAAIVGPICFIVLTYGGYRFYKKYKLEKQKKADRGGESSDSFEESSESKSSEVEGTENESAEAKPTEAKPTPAMPILAKPIQARPKPANPLLAKLLQAKTTPAKPTEANPTEDKPAEAIPTEDKPAEDKPAEDKPSGSSIKKGQSEAEVIKEVKSVKSVASQKSTVLKKNRVSNAPDEDN